MIYFLAALMALFFEGLLLTLIPSQWKETMKQILYMSDAQIRRIGFAMCLAAVVMIVCLNRFGALP